MERKVVVGYWLAGKEYAEGDCLVFGLQGVCRLVGTTKDSDGAEVILQPVYDSRSRLMLPVDSPAVEAKVRPLMTKEEVRSLIQDIPDEPVGWIPNENERKNYYREVFSSGDRRELSRMIKSLKKHQEGLEKRGRRLYRVDEKYLQEALRMLYQEIAFVLGMEVEDMPSYIEECLRKMS